MNVKLIRAIVAAIALLPALAGAQSSPGFVFGQVPTAAQWNSYFAGKMDYTGGGIPISSGGTGATTAAGARASLGLGTAAIYPIGTSGTTVPLLNSANTWAAAQTFSSTINGNTWTPGTGTLNLTSKTLTISGSVTLAGSDGATLNYGAGGTLGTGAFASAYILPAATSSTLGGVKPDGTSIANTAGAISWGLPASLSTSYLSTKQVAGTTGTTANTLCKIDSTGNVVTAAAADVGILGICVTTKTSGQNVEVATRGVINCVADNATTVGNRLIPGTSTPGTCRDSGQASSSGIQSSTQIIGIAKTAVSGGANVSVQLFGPGHYGTSLTAGTRLGWRVVSMADATSITPTGDTADENTQINTQAIGTLTVNNPSGTPADGQRLVLRIKSTNVQTFSWGGIYRGSLDTPLPTVSSGSSLTDYIAFLYNGADSKFDLVGLNFGH